MTDEREPPTSAESPDAVDAPDAPADVPTSAGTEELARPSGDELAGRGDGPAVRETSETELESPGPDRGSDAVDDHVAGRAPSLGHQPTGALDRGVDGEHLRSPSQGVRPTRR